MKTTWLIVLTIAVIWTALEVVEAEHKSRLLFSQQENLRVAIDELDVVWEQLLVEQATIGSYGKIERRAREELKMYSPSIEQIQVLKSK